MATDVVLGRWNSSRPAARESGWDVLYAEQLPRIYNFFRYRVGHGVEAEDLTSLTFEKAWVARERFDRDRGAFGTWILAVARNVAVDHYRSRGKRQTVPLEEASNLPGGATPEEIHSRRADAERLARLLEQLPDEDRELMALKFGAGLSNLEIAGTTGLTTTNVGTRVHRIVARLKVAWNKEGATL